MICTVGSVADHARLAKVLAGDPVACWALALVLPDAELDALILRVEQMGAEVLVDASAAARREEGRTLG